ncbi:MAG: phosphotransferase enzyme family protein [Elusimicrobia bacterium GWA2_56_46]|nr:MAG: phosphotransferase enzyme family protein [Elusimicrobia bacterium GWA2_56_46]OGR55791.1 MAG: phosphotransferase enzyme family protein [Elusimicrobia bacterium GWC2_56_31]HBB67971.1 phosphotransferase enzyme family protein [Elusimicrobiota bacterium]HBW22280.1 phosphotransferase enzyme family protein [Elusimicrobiota bacterium]
MPIKKTELQPPAAAVTAEGNLKALFKKTFGSAPETMEPLKGDGSARRLFRLGGAGRTVIGAAGPDKLENAAFIEFSKHFRKEGLPVPEIYASDLSRNIYLEEDLGDMTLFQFLLGERSGPGFPAPALAAYKKTLDWLPRFQLGAGKTLDYKHCYPRDSFDRRSIMWDLNYFKYYFLRLSKIPFNEQKLEDDFNVLAGFLLEAEISYFMYRDFQSRNVMLRDGEPYFIDYQGGRKGALQYDVASLLYDAKADIPYEIRSELLGYYLDAAALSGKADRARFMKYFHGYVYVRIMQALGAYGLRGFYEGKTQFLQSVPYAVRNIEWLLRNAEVPVKLPELTRIFKSMAASSYLRQFGAARLGLTVRVSSFSYRNGFPSDDKGHGGGFVFDCRFLPNPGREARYAPLTGRDAEVAAYLAGTPQAGVFLEDVFRLVDPAVENYLSRNFTDLMISFGCTGGRHRSVYCAERLKKHLEDKYRAGAVKVELRHRELETPPKEIPLT